MTVVDNYFSSDNTNMIQKQPMRPFMRQSKNYVAVIQRINSNVYGFKPKNNRLPENTEITPTCAKKVLERLIRNFAKTAEW